MIKIPICECFYRQFNIMPDVDVKHKWLLHIFKAITCTIFDFVLDPHCRGILSRNEKHSLLSSVIKALEQRSRGLGLYSNWRHFCEFICSSPGRSLMPTLPTLYNLMKTRISFQINRPFGPDTKNLRTTIAIYVFIPWRSWITAVQKTTKP